MRHLNPTSLVCAVVCGWAATASADGVGSVNIVGYAWGGAGFEFSPTTSLSVTALGYIGNDVYNAPYQVSLWDTSGDQLASALVSTNTPWSGQGYFQAISSLTLDAGDTYYLGAVRPDNGLWLGNAIISSGPDANGTFGVAPQISYLGYATGTNADGTFPAYVSNDPSALLIGADFEFQLSSGGANGPMLASTIPEPSVVGLAGCALAALLSWKRRS